MYAVVRPFLLMVSPHTSMSRVAADRRTSALVLAQIEWYLSSSRLAADKVLMEQSRDYDGWLPISTLLSYPRMRKLCHPQVDTTHKHARTRANRQR